MGSKVTLEILFYDYSCQFFFLQPIAEWNCELTSPFYSYIELRSCRMLIQIAASRVLKKFRSWPGPGGNSCFSKQNCTRILIWVQNNELLLFSYFFSNFCWHQKSAVLLQNLKFLDIKISTFCFDTTL